MRRWLKIKKPLKHGKLDLRILCNSLLRDHIKSSPFAYTRKVRFYKVLKYRKVRSFWKKCVNYFILKRLRRALFKEKLNYRAKADVSTTKVSNSNNMSYKIICTFHWLFRVAFFLIFQCILPFLICSIHEILMIFRFEIAFRKCGVREVLSLLCECK